MAQRVAGHCSRRHYPCRVTIRLYDTSARQIRDFVPLARGLCLDLPLRRHRAGRPAHRAHPVGPELRHHAPLVRLPRLRRDVHPQRHGHRRQDHREVGRAGPPVVVDRLRERARVQRRLHRARLPAADLRAARHRPHHRDGRDDARPDRARSRVRGRRQRLLRRALLPRLPGALQPGPRRPPPAPGRGRDRQARPARLRHVEGRQARRAELGDPLGPRAVPAGTWSARRWRTSTWAPPSTSTAAAST